MSIKVIYHANCNDGFAAAVVAKRYFTSCLFYGNDKLEFIPANYGDKPPTVTSEDRVYILDFSYPRDILEKMCMDCAFLWVLDHHKTAQKDLEGFENATFNMEESGATLAWQHFFPAEDVPDFLRYIRDRDLWNWQLPQSREFHAALASYPREFLTWEKFLDSNMKGIGKLFQEGVAILRYQQNIVRATLEQKRCYIELQGYAVPVINTNHLISEKLNSLSIGEPFAVAYFDIPEEAKRVYSLRSDSHDSEAVDVSEIAKAYGGGGHKHAAGFTTDLPTLPLFSY